MDDRERLRAAYAVLIAAALVGFLIGFVSGRML